jgi:hypothetical protein
MFRPDQVDHEGNIAKNHDKAGEQRADKAVMPASIC